MNKKTLLFFGFLGFVSPSLLWATSTESLKKEPYYEWTELYKQGQELQLSKDSEQYWQGVCVAHPDKAEYMPSPSKEAVLGFKHINGKSYSAVFFPSDQAENQGLIKMTEEGKQSVRKILSEKIDGEINQGISNKNKRYIEPFQKKVSSELKSIQELASKVSGEDNGLENYQKIQERLVYLQILSEEINKANPLGPEVIEATCDENTGCKEYGFFNYFYHTFTIRDVSSHYLVELRADENMNEIVAGVKAFYTTSSSSFFMCKFQAENSFSYND